MDVSEDLQNSGVAVAGCIDPALINDVSAYAQSYDGRRQRFSRQTILDWNTKCDAILSYFETVSDMNFCTPAPLTLALCSS